MDNNLIRDLTIAVVGAVIGGFIGARVDRRLAAVSSWYRNRTAASRAKREQIVGVLCANPQLLAVAYLDALVGVMLLAATFFAFLQAANSIDAAPLGLAATDTTTRPWTRV